MANGENSGSGCFDDPHRRTIRGKAYCNGRCEKQSHAAKPAAHSSIGQKDISHLTANTLLVEFELYIPFYATC